MTVNPLRTDPTRTKTLRLKFERDLTRRFRRLHRSINDLLLVKDALGLLRGNRRFLRMMQNVESDQQVNLGEWLEETTGHSSNEETGRTVLDSIAWEGVNPSALSFNVEPLEWSFLTDASKLAEFEKWLQEETGLTIVPEGDRYWEQYVQEGYERGAGKAFDAANKKQLILRSESFMTGRKTQFMTGMLGAPESVEKIKLLAARTFTDIKGVNATMATSLRRILTDGLAQGQNPNTIARTMAEDLFGRRRGSRKDGGALFRAKRIARTEIIRAHAEGQLDALERMGVEQVGVAVEWSTAGDTRVCPLCIELEGMILKTKEAHNLIPRHPQCRCAFVPANVGEQGRAAQLRTKTKIQSAISKSLKKEGGRRKSRWSGKSKKIDKTRPVSPLSKERAKGKITERRVKPTTTDRSTIERKRFAGKMESREGQPVTYHGTSIQFLESIKSKGLVPDVGAAGKAVYTTETFGEALEYGVFAAGKKSSIVEGDRLAIVVARHGGKEVTGPHGKWRLFEEGVPLKSIERVDIYDAKKVQRVLRGREDFPSIEELEPFKISEEIINNTRRRVFSPVVIKGAK